MYVSTDGPSLDMFDAQPAVTHWSEVCHRRAGVRKTKRQDEEDEDKSLPLIQTWIYPNLVI